MELVELLQVLAVHAALLLLKIAASSTYAGINGCHQDMGSDEKELPYQ